MGIRYLFSFVCFSIISLTTFVSISQTVPIYTGFVALINYFISVFRSGRFYPGEIVFAAVGNLFDLLHLDGKKITLAVWVFFLVPTEGLILWWPHDWSSPSSGVCVCQTHRLSSLHVRVVVSSICPVYFMSASHPQNWPSLRIQAIQIIVSKSVKSHSYRHMVRYLCIRWAVFVLFILFCRPNYLLVHNANPYRSVVS